MIDCQSSSIIATIQQMSFLFETPTEPWILPRGTFPSRRKISHVVFDFDGTLSLLRQGWPETMLSMFLELLPAKADESELRRELHTEILNFNGRQTIHQMNRFAERVAERGGNHESGKSYLKEYSRRLRIGLDQRIERLKTAKYRNDEYLVFASRAFLEFLRGKGIHLVLLSGTLEAYVREEAELLGIADYFERGIFGGDEDPTRFSKEAVFDQILAEDRIHGGALLSFGDGPVEIRAAAERGGLSVAVASDELNNGSGNIDPTKRDVLVDAGAHAVIPDYRNALELVKAIQDK